MYLSFSALLPYRCIYFFVFCEKNKGVCRTCSPKRWSVYRGNVGNRVLSSTCSLIEERAHALFIGYRLPLQATLEQINRKGLLQGRMEGCTHLFRPRDEKDLHVTLQPAIPAGEILFNFTTHFFSTLFLSQFNLSFNRSCHDSNRLHDVEASAQPFDPCFRFESVNKIDRIIGNILSFMSICRHLYKAKIYFIFSQ